jgi:hypothetical protein
LTSPLIGQLSGHVHAGGPAMTLVAYDSPLTVVGMYARFSNDGLQRDSSITDQFRTCTEEADERGWVVDPSLQFSDAGLSGALMATREGLQCLREKSSARAFKALSGAGYWSGCTQDAQPGEVVGQCGQGEFVGDLVQSTGAKLANVALLFKYSEDRFNYRLAPRVGGLSARTSQLGPHAAVGRGIGPGAATGAQVQRPRHVRIRDISNDVSLFHLLEVVDRIRCRPSRCGKT